MLPNLTISTVQQNMIYEGPAYDVIIQHPRCIITLNSLLTVMHWKAV